MALIEISNKTANWIVGTFLLIGIPTISIAYLFQVKQLLRNTPGGIVILGFNYAAVAFMIILWVFLIASLAKSYIDFPKLFAIKDD